MEQNRKKTVKQKSAQSHENDKEQIQDSKKIIGFSNIESLNMGEGTISFKKPDIHNSYENVVYKAFLSSNQILNFNKQSLLSLQHEIDQVISLISEKEKKIKQADIPKLSIIEDSIVLFIFNEVSSKEFQEIKNAIVANPELSKIYIEVFIAVYQLDRLLSNLDNWNLINTQFRDLLEQNKKKVSKEKPSNISDDYSISLGLFLNESNKPKRLTNEGMPIESNLNEDSPGFSEFLMEAAKLASQSAVNENMALGIPFLFTDREGKMWKQMPDGSVVFVKQTDQKWIKIPKKKYKIG